MTNKEVFSKIEELFCGKEGHFIAFSSNNKVPLGKLTAIRTKGDSDGIAIFEFSATKKIGLQTMLMIFSVVKEESEKGFSGDDLLSQFYLDEKEFGEILKSIFTLFGKGE